MVIKVKTEKKRQIIDITDFVEKELGGDGVVNIFVKHTTAAVTAADLDPGTDEDILDALQAMTPSKDWRHPHDPAHLPDHLWAAIVGPSLSVPYKDGRLQLGAWQRIILIELDGPRSRELRLSTA